jgi:hypothetical protein
MTFKKTCLSVLITILIPVLGSCCRMPAETGGGDEDVGLLCRLFKIGCPEPEKDDTTDTEPVSPVNLDPVFLMTKSKIFLIGGDPAGYQGTAFLLQSKDKRYLVTNFHVISTIKDLFVETEDKVVYKGVKVLAANRNHDIAILDARTLPASLKGIQYSTSYATSQKIYVVGFPDMRSKDQNLNFISGVISDASYTAPCYIGKCDSKNIQFSAPINPGHSGSPVLNNRGEALGVVSWRFGKDSDIQGGNYAVPFQYVSPMIREIETRKKSLSELFPEGKVCTGDEDCDWLYFCINEECRTLKDKGETCSLHEDCYLPYNCFNGACSDSGTKGESCQYDSQCAPPSYCIMGSCRPLGEKGDTCAYDSDCVSPLYCIIGKCVTELSGPGGKCEKNSDCKYPYNCVGGACEEVDVGSIEGKSCSADADCSPLYCILGKCGHLRKEGEKCEKTVDCVSGLKCGKKGICVPLGGPGDSCDTDYDCRLPLYCIKGKCKDKAEVGTEGAQGEACTSDAECVPPNYCILKKCRPLGKLGDACATYLDCEAPLNCTNGKCVQ